MLKDIQHLAKEYSKEPLRFLYVNKGFGEHLGDEAGFVLIKGKR